MHYASALAAHNRLLAIDRERDTVRAARRVTRSQRARIEALDTERDAILADPRSYERQGYPFRMSYGVPSADRTRVLAYIDIL